MGNQLFQLRLFAVCERKLVFGDRQFSGRQLPDRGEALLQALYDTGKPRPHFEIAGMGRPRQGTVVPNPDPVDLRRSQAHQCVDDCVTILPHSQDRHFAHFNDAQGCR